MICWIERGYCISRRQRPFQFTRLLAESKYHYKYFGDNQTDKQSVVTILNYVANLRRDNLRIQNLRSSTLFAVITVGLKGQKIINSLANL